MNANLTHTLDSLFGPPSDPIVISEFLQSSSTLLLNLNHEDGSLLADIAEQCSVEDIQHSLHETWSNPTLSAYLTKDHDHKVTALFSSAQKSATKTSRKAPLPDPDTFATEAAKVQKELDQSTLNSIRLNTDAVLFMRTPKNSDQNILHKLKEAASADVIVGDTEAVLIISIYNKVSWGPSYVTRSSQHACVSSQTLEDLYNVIPCTSHGPPAAEAGIPPGRKDGVICIEGLAYSHGHDSDGYADKLIRQLELSKKKDIALNKAPTSLQCTQLSSLSLRINEPYWLLHNGNCEHFLVVEQIRLHHPLDPRSGYPLTLQITPPILNLCRACTKVPAIWSIVGDIRLDGSPCLLCGPCWRNMGPSDDPNVVVLPLPEHTYCS